MRFGIFFGHQLPRPWTVSSEANLLRDTLAQVELADRLGFDYVWTSEHHFLEEYCHSSAPEVFLAAASQRTKNIRLGHGIINMMPQVNHPARIAERVATLDLISGGRVDLGTGASSSAAELGGFLVDRSERRKLWLEATDIVTRMMVEEPFAGSATMAPRNVVPKPHQKPHPPLWIGCSQRDTIRFAAQCGVGALSFVEPEDISKWVSAYYATLASQECVPVGFSVNPAIGAILPMMISASPESDAIKRAKEAMQWYGYSLGHYMRPAPHAPGVTNLWGEFRNGRNGGPPAGNGNGRQVQGERMRQGAGKTLPLSIGTPAQARELVKLYNDAGVDQLVFVMQVGHNTHEDICNSLALFAADVMPEFVEGREEREAAKAERLAPAIEAALARRTAPRKLSTPYVIDEQAELESLAR